MSNSPDYIKPALIDALPAYQLVRDCYDGELAVKQRNYYSVASSNNGAGGSSTLALSKYLPDPSPASESEDIKKARYNAYVERAVFYNVTKRTIMAMVGAVFSKYPALNLGQLDILETDIDGAGQTLMQQAKAAFTECLITGRGGLLADMPVGEGASRSQIASGEVRPRITYYPSESIINWRTRKVGGFIKTSLIVLSESYDVADDGYEAKQGRQLLVLRLNEQNLAESEIFRKEDDAGNWISQGVNPIRGSNGSALDSIPFYPFGAVNNDLEIDDSPMYDIAHLNIAHFRNSADYEEGNFIAGQPTLVLSGLTQEWVNDVMEGGIAFGSRSGIPLPQGASAQLLQAQPNGAVMEAMKHKEQQMTALGAKLIEESSQTKTATEAAQDNADESNTLTNIAYNVSDAYTKAVKACARYMGYDDSELSVALNTVFNFAKMTPQQRQQLIAEWQSGAITWSEMRGKLVEDEVATIEDADVARQTIEQEQGAMITQERV